MTNKYAEIDYKLRLYNACKGIYRVKTAGMGRYIKPVLTVRGKVYLYQASDGKFFTSDAFLANSDEIDAAYAEKAKAGAVFDSGKAAEAEAISPSPKPGPKPGMPKFGDGKFYHETPDGSGFLYEGAGGQIIRSPIRLNRKQIEKAFLAHPGKGEIDFASLGIPDDVVARAKARDEAALIRGVPKGPGGPAHDPRMADPRTASGSPLGSVLGLGDSSGLGSDAIMKLFALRALFGGGGGMGFGGFPMAYAAYGGGGADAMQQAMMMQAMMMGMDPAMAKEWIAKQMKAYGLGGSDDSSAAAASSGSATLFFTPDGRCFNSDGREIDSRVADELLAAGKVKAVRVGRGSSADAADAGGGGGSPDAGGGGSPDDGGGGSPDAGGGGSPDARKRVFRPITDLTPYEAIGEYNKTRSDYIDKFVKARGDAFDKRWSGTAALGLVGGAAGGAGLGYLAGDRISKWLGAKDNSFWNNVARYGLGAAGGVAGGYYGHKWTRAARKAQLESLDRRNAAKLFDDKYAKGEIDLYGHDKDPRVARDDDGYLKPKVKVDPDAFDAGGGI